MMSKQTAEIFIKAPIETVFRFITDWRNVSHYERFIKKIEPVNDPPPTDRQRWAISHFKFLGIELKSLYRYWSIPPSRYGGEQVAGIFRGGFWFSLEEKNGGTHLKHGEFINSNYKLLESFLGFLFWRVLFRKDIERQLYKLKELLEGKDCLPSRYKVNGRLTRLAGQSLLD